MSAVILVPFHGTGAGEADLSWGQREIWAAMCAQESSLSGGSADPLPEGRTVDYAVSLLSFIMGRYPSYRTRLRFASNGTVRQVLSDHGEIPLHVVDVPDDVEPAAAAETLRSDWVRQKFDYENEWPIRMGVIRHRGVLTHSVAVHCHLAMDGGGIQNVLEDLVAYHGSGGAAADGDTGPAPDQQESLDQVRWQQSPAGERHHAMVVRHWRKLLSHVSSDRFVPTDDERAPRYWRVAGRSAAARVATHAISNRVGRGDTSPVLMAATAVALARVTGVNPTVLQVVVNNRFRPGLAATAGPVAQSGLCAIDVAGVTFDGAVDRAWRSLMSAYLNAYYDPDRMAAAIDELGRERGAPIDLDCFFNDHRGPSEREYTGGPPPQAALDAAARMTTTWGPHSELPVPRFYVHVFDAPDAIELLVHADTRYVPPDDLSAFLNRFEEVLVDSAFDSTVLTGVSTAEAVAGRS